MYLTSAIAKLQSIEERGRAFDCAGISRHLDSSSTSVEHAIAEGDEMLVQSKDLYRRWWESSQRGDLPGAMTSLSN